MYRFGDFSLDVERRELRRADELIHLEPQAFDLLVLLAGHPDRVISNVELLDGVWGHRFVSEANITTRIKEARRAVGDDGRQQHTIRNARGRGYRFVASVAEFDAAAGRPDSSESRLIGRSQELQSVAHLLARSPLVTLIGAGGVGKSTLALAIAAQCDGRYRDGVHVIELGVVPSGESLVSAVARTVDVVVENAREVEAIRSIADLDALLVLDSCEHMLDDASDFADRLLRVAGASVQILATSQVRLGLSDEVVVALEPLSIEDASELFAARVRSVVPSWDPSSIGIERVDRLLSSLDRLPLTIEMAAARMGSMTFDDLDQAIAEGIPLLQMSHRASARRHRSLESLVNWSAELLDTREREIFTRFSVFAGPVTADDAAPILEPHGSTSVAFDLAALSERSLLVADYGQPRTRYRMLTTMRTVAEHWLEESGAAAEVRRQHAEHVLAVLEAIDDRLRTSQELAARQRLDGLVDEARAAHRWARRHDPELASSMSSALFHAAYSSLWHEPAEWSRTLLAEAGIEEEASFPGAQLLIAGAAAHSGDLTLARAGAESVAAGATGRLRAVAIELLADVALYEGDLEGAMRAAIELQQIGDDLGDAHAAAFGSVDAALALVFRGDSHGALAVLEAVDLGEIAPTDRAWLALARGDALSALGDPTAATAFLEAIELGASVGNRLVVSVSRTSLATDYARAGDSSAALDAYASSFDDYVRHGNFTHAVTAMRNLIGLLHQLGDDRAATVVAGAVANGQLRMSFGTEAEQIAGVLDDIEHRVGSHDFSTWLEAGRSLDLNRALRTAADFVEHHRNGSSDSPHTTHEQSDTERGPMHA